MGRARTGPVFSWSGARGDQHALRPPLTCAAHFEQIRAQPIEEAVDDRLQRPVPAGFDPHAHRLAVGARDTHRVDAALGKRIQTGVEDAGLLERRHVTVVHPVILDQVAHRGVGRQTRQVVDLLRRAAEAGSLQQVGGAVAAPFRVGNGRQIAGPTRRPGAQRLPIPCRFRPRTGREQDEQQTDCESPPPDGSAAPFHWCFPSDACYILAGRRKGQDAGGCQRSGPPGGTWRSPESASATENPRRLNV